MVFPAVTGPRDRRLRWGKDRELSIDTNTTWQNAAIQGSRLIRKPYWTAHSLLDTIPSFGSTRKCLMFERSAYQSSSKRTTPSPSAFVKHFEN
ncbi:hypothetical protein PGTUg99_036877 [Puccinia graminis f. sp. tritici]|uniref:Uncharacterized protein n=1 Tax=Puccinia graminis f. sp. tritici TaxID=56615 RepID=A0A5B0SR42_PUCGR|nr:hypothetical protein PGTUg99_036877 [Puccinia graminis f. sp. tritici]